MTLTIPANDHGKIYVFEVATDLASQSASVGALAQGLGVASLDPDFVDVVTLADLPEGGIGWYLQEGYGLEPTPEQQVALATIPSQMVLVMSRAFGGTETIIDTTGGLRHVITLTQPDAAADMTPLTSEGAKGTLEGGAPVEGSQRPSRVYLYALILIFAFFALMAWRIASGAV